VGRLAREEFVGVGVDIHPSAEFIDVDRLVIGDHSYIGPGVRVIGGNLEVGEYSKIHKDCYLYPKNGINLGHCTWLGQGTHLDGTGGIKAGDFLGVGINSALYSHIRHGDVLEGCTFDKNGFLDIGHDVWFVGMCLVSPVRVHDKSVALLGSVVTREMQSNHVYGGNPAIDLTSRLGEPWREVSHADKYANLTTLIDQFFADNRSVFDRDEVHVVTEHSGPLNGVTNYDVSSRSYTKTNSPTEVALNKWLFRYRAKFRPTTDI